MDIDWCYWDDSEDLSNPKNIFNEVKIEWYELFLRPELLQYIKNNGYENPNQIQTQFLPHALQGHDVLCTAKPGTGKTVSAIISILNQIDIYEEKKFQCLVICPTRQVALQTYAKFKSFTSFFKRQIIIDCYCGGVSIGECEKTLKLVSNFPEIVIGAVGKLRELSKKYYIQPYKVRFLIVEGCDEIIGNPSLRLDFHQIFLATPHYKQVLMFSSNTLSPQIKKNCQKYLDPQIFITVDKSTCLSQLTHFYMHILQEKKLTKLMNLLDKIIFKQAIIFVNKIDRAIKLAQILTKKMFNPICLHSKLPQKRREKHLQDFSKKNSQILIATDEASHGLDTKNVNLIINYDFPLDFDAYSFRMGRTAHAKKGLILSFVCQNKKEDQKRNEDQKVSKQVGKKLNLKIEQLPNQISLSLIE